MSMFCIEYYDESNMPAARWNHENNS